MSTLEKLLDVRGVTKSFVQPSGPVRVLHHVDLTVEEREFIAITGPSGSGKTTFLHLAALLDRPSSGRITFDGQVVSRLSEPALCDLRKLKIGMVFQNYCLLPHRSVLENVLFRFRYMDVSRTEARAKALDALSALGLTGLADRPVRVLSGGEMQRVAIARGICVEPRLFLADEPTGNLDGDAARTMMESLVQLNRRGITILMVTHNRSLLTYATRQVECREGRIGGAQA